MENRINYRQNQINSIIYDSIKERLYEILSMISKNIAETEQSYSIKPCDTIFGHIKGEVQYMRGCSHGLHMAKNIVQAHIHEIEELQEKEDLEYLRKKGILH